MTNPHDQRPADAGAHIDLPPILYVEDLARLLRITEAAVRKRLRLG